MTTDDRIVNALESIARRLEEQTEAIKEQSAILERAMDIIATIGSAPSEALHVNVNGTIFTES